MEVPNLIGEKLDEALKILKECYSLLNIVVNEYNVPENFHKKREVSGVKRVVKQWLIPDGGIELIVADFNESPRPLFMEK